MRCLVLGGSGVLGRAVCRRLAANGAQVAFSFHRGVGAASELRGEGAIPLQLDLADPAAIDATVDKAAEALGGLDALVICSGAGVALEPEGPGSRHLMERTDAAAFDALMAVNVRGPFLACRRVLRHLDSHGGNVVIVASLDAAKALPSPVHFACTQLALRGLAQAMAKENGAHGIRVNVVAAGLMETGLSRLVGEEQREEYRRLCGLRRLARPDEIAEVVAWWALHNGYATGQTLVVDGCL